MRLLQSICVTMVFTSLTFVITPSISQAQFVVHDPINEIHLLAQVQHDIQMVQAAMANLQSYQSSWTNVGSRLVNMKQLVQTGANNQSISLAVANAQINQIQSELAAIKQLQTLANGAQGNLQIAGAQARLQSEVISQLAEQRQLTISEIEQDQKDKQDALDYYHTPAKDPSTY